MALVTGAATRLGREFLRQLAPRCAELLLVVDADTQLPGALSVGRGNARRSPLIADLATVEGQVRVVEALRQRGPVRFLINAAGSDQVAGPLAMDPERDLSRLRLRQEAMLVLCRAALPSMREGGGTIVNGGSVEAFLPLPGAAAEAAGAAFVLAYSEALQAEEASHGIRVRCVCTGPASADDLSAAVADSLAPAGPVTLIPGATQRAAVAAALARQRASVEQQSLQHRSVDRGERR